ncbi:MAG TPA: glutathionylspermidine synthase family protein [Verrucomicrobiae bacterium]|nr:glutathionylspermidine synthase family protein [Verrucomicrobiae bacterium]
MKAGNAFGLRTELPIGLKEFSALRRRALLEGCKWDPQVGDISTLATFPLVMNAGVWKRLAFQAERLSAEAVAAENEISQRPELLGNLGLPRALRRVLTSREPLTPAPCRVMRFDFHPTVEGWRVSEVNSDVPGGFSEASHFTALMAEHFPGLRPAGNPAGAWSRAIATAIGIDGVCALLSAPGFMEDHQVNAFLASQLRKQGCHAFLAKPEQILWRNGTAHLNTEWHRGPLNGVIRFYQAEWLSRLPPRCEWKYFFRGGKTPVLNPALSVISESKRFPLTWQALAVKLPVWRELLPRTCDPRDVPWESDERWLLKTALCNNGDTVCIRELMKPSDWFRTRLAVRIFPGQWLAQGRFESVPVPTPAGPRHVCVGVYTVNGAAAGAYARLSEKTVIDFSATDVALLIDDHA